MVFSKAMYSKKQISENIQGALVWVFFVQLGLLCGIEGIYIAAFTGITEFDEAYNNPSISMIGLATSMYPIMAAIGAFVVLFLVRVMNENFLLMISMYLWLAGYLTGSLCLGKMSALIIARILKGAAIGVITSVIPLYAEKVSASRQRAAQLLTLFQAAVPLGILMMVLIGKLSTKTGFTVRWICAAAPVFPANLIVFYLPQQRRKPNVQLHSNESRATLSQNIKNDFRELFATRQAALGFMAATLAQCGAPLTAINVVFYYSSTMCQMLGFNPQDAGYMAMGLYACNLVGTGLSLGIINKLPRVVTISYSVLSMAILHATIFALLLVQSQWPENSLWGLIAITMLFAFVFVFAMFYSGISLVYTSEVVMPKSRDMSIGCATSLGWVTNFTISMVAPVLMDKIGFYTFLVFVYICCGLFVAFSVMPKPHNAPEVVKFKRGIDKSDI